MDELKEKSLVVLVIGGDGRGHALAWALAKSKRVAKVYVSPGNAGTKQEPKCENVFLSDNEACAAFAEHYKVDITIVGPEAPLVGGIVDLFRSRGLKIFGPTQEAAELEGSKLFAKAFMGRHGIPTASYETFDNATTAHAYIDSKKAPIVVKADGLAAGKGVVVAMTIAEAHTAVDMMLVDNKFGDAGARVVIEEFLTGQEVTFSVMVDENGNVFLLATSQDHKRLLDGDKGPNTGGMGAISPAPIVTPALRERIMSEIVMLTVQGMIKEGRPYTGFLYFGLMIDTQGNPKVLEFNCRLGDPETQVILPRFTGDLADTVEHALNGTLDQATAKWDSRTAIGVVFAAKGYPDSPRKGDSISGVPCWSTNDCKVFHAGTAINEDGILVTSGGRVLCAVALHEDIGAARRAAYVMMEKIHIPDGQYRTDIGIRSWETAVLQQDSKRTRP